MVSLCWVYSKLGKIDLINLKVKYLGYDFMGDITVLTKKGRQLILEIN